MSTAETKLEVIARHVLSAREVVRRQRQLIATHKANGRDTELAEKLLDQFERTLAIFEQKLTEAKAPPESK